MREIQPRATTSPRRFKKALAMSGAVAATAATVMTAGTTPAAGATASTAVYWAFRSTTDGDCLTTYQSGTIVTAPCAADSRAQEWSWINSWSGEYRLLKNRWTGKCLITTNPVTSGSCDDWTSRQWKNSRQWNGDYWICSKDWKCFWDRSDSHDVHLYDFDATTWQMIERDRVS